MILWILSSRSARALLTDIVNNLLLQVQADVELLRQALPYYVTDNTGITDLDNLLDQVCAHCYIAIVQYMSMYMVSKQMHALLVLLRLILVTAVHCIDCYY
jgi:mannose/fructose/N-acetylgalactosamine-specific phosphotransferase system component IID